MPAKSRYTNDEFELIMQDVLKVLEQHKVSHDLSIMVLGNLVSSIIQNKIPKDARPIMIDKFCTALKTSALS